MDHRQLPVVQRRVHGGLVIPVLHGPDIAVIPGDAETAVFRRNGPGMELPVEPVQKERAGLLRHSVVVFDMPVQGDAFPAVGHRRGQSEGLRHREGIRLDAPGGQRHEMPLLPQLPERLLRAFRDFGGQRLGERAVYVKKKYMIGEPPVSMH